ncbi:hypothetical protein Afil01_41660 [Actinorhabdospora filicis]|uniref:Excreted virulence factor EspC, type VII ESX diderm n=1 Tax=Actinorhabdospora filicis TaxID=1785913 RepID=A0A9W6SNY9_9ACTN|nr:hypothetical protein [Actinorhabdospora filicis]GLZ79359.1 hypothetical protein Afil01_41660 [Actinorhabdospora filicis]
MTGAIRVDIDAVEEQARQIRTRARQIREQADLGRSAGTPLGAYGRMPEPFAQALDPIDADLASGLETYAEVLEAAAEALMRVVEAYTAAERGNAGAFDALGSFFGRRSKGRRR